MSSDTLKPLLAKLPELTVSDLDQLLAEAAHRRSKMQPQPPTEMPTAGYTMIRDPGWAIRVLEDRPSIGLQFSHPALGWIAYELSFRERDNFVAAVTVAAQKAQAHASRVATKGDKGTGGVH